jgi:hypothetical protein
MHLNDYIALKQDYPGANPERVSRVNKENYNDALDLIFEWVETHVIELEEFKVLIKANRESTS